MSMLCERPGKRSGKEKNFEMLKEREYIYFPFGYVYVSRIEVHAKSKGEGWNIHNDDFF